VIQFEEELTRLDKEIQNPKGMSADEKKLANEDFLRKAPGEVVHKEREKVQVLGKKLEKLEDIWTASRG